MGLSAEGLSHLVAPSHARGSMRGARSGALACGGALQRRYSAVRAGARYPCSGAGDSAAVARIRALTRCAIIRWWSREQDDQAGLRCQHSAMGRDGRPIFPAKDARKTNGFR